MLSNLAVLRSLAPFSCLPVLVCGLVETMHLLFATRACTPARDIETPEYLEAHLTYLVCLPARSYRTPMVNPRAATTILPHPASK